MKTLIILCLPLMLLSVFRVHAQAQQKSKRDPASYVDVAAFDKITKEAKAHRQKRLVTLDDFLKMAQDKNTIVLDTRSKWAFDTLHIEGARHLNFSDFTEQKLAKVLGDKSVRVLIYCNNNFFSESNLPGAVATKAAGLALNIPTFINLYGYGYKNVYELGVSVDVDDKRLKLVRKSSAK